jgi:Recombination endonuclease VII
MPLIGERKQFCPKGHDTLITGRRDNGCIVCANVRSMNWNFKNSERKRDLTYKKRYGITLVQYNELLVKQNFACAICETPQSMLPKRLNVDHNHETGKVRGLLCWDCNKRLGWIENKSFCAKASLYLQGAQSCL